MAKFKFYIGCGNYWGRNSPNDLFNNTYAPRLMKLGIKENKMEEVAKMFEEIYSMGYENGADNMECEIAEVS